MHVSHSASLPSGFSANAVSCGIKKSGKPDLALIYSSVPARAASCFTSNTMKAAPVVIDQLRLKRKKSFRAILANSGNANCCNGKQGIADALASSDALAVSLGVSCEEILLASTGIIGRPLPVERMVGAMPALAKGLSQKGIRGASEAILTTDTRSKEVTVRFVAGGKKVTICGVAKGSGMISPSMATMLCFIMTDAQLTQEALEASLKVAVDESFNCITVDGCMSTNDTVILLANGCAGNTSIASGSQRVHFSRALHAVCLELAKMIVADAEGMTKFITIRVAGARTRQEARTVGLAIANSNLFKTAMYGQNPNFGRIAAAAGASGVPVREHDIRVKVGSLKKKTVDVQVTLNQGNAGAVVYTSDLTPEYVKINAEYT